MRGRLLALLGLLFLGNCVFGQNPPNIRRIEYFIDNDPGYGMGHPVPFAPGTELIDVNVDVPLTGIDPGFHRLYLRASNTNHVWSALTTSVFFKENVDVASGLPNIQSIEYFIDEDPGYGKGNPIPFAPGAELHDIDVLIPLNDVDPGFRRLYIRAKDVNQRWSALTTSVFFKENVTAATPVPNLIYLEYFIGNTDPGYGKGTKINFSPGTEVNDISFIIDLSAPTIPEGTHNLHIRGRDANGTWSSILSSPFSKCNGPVPVLNTPTAITPAGFTLSWTEALGAAYYELDISTDNFQTFVTGYNARNVPARTITVSNLSPATTYQVRVRGFGNCASVASNIRVAPTLVTPPAPPTALNITGVTETSLALGWTQPTPNPTGYLVLRKAGSTVDFVPAVNTSYTKGTVVSPGVVVAYSGPLPMPPEQNLTPGTHYHYAIYAFNQLGSLVSYSGGNPLTGEVSTKAQCQVPVVNFDIEPACATQSVKFINRSTNLLPGASFRWTYRPGTVVTQAAGDGSHIYPAAGTYNVELHILQSGVCKDSLTKQVQIRDLPILLFSNGPALVNTQTSFTVAAGNVPPNPTYVWDFNDDGVADVSNATGTASHVFTSTGTFPVSVTLTDNQGCSVTSSRGVVVTLPTGGSSAVADFSSNVSCQGTPTTFTNLSQNVPADATFEWDFNNDGVVDNTSSGNPQFTYAAPGLFTCLLRINVPGSAAVTASRIVEVRGRPVTPFLIAESSTSICQGTSVNLVPATIAAGLTYQWKINSQPLAGATASSIAATSPGVYSLDVANACGSTASSNAVTITVLTPPDIRTVVASGSTELCEGETVILSVTGQTGVSYQWKRNGADLQFANSSVLIASQSGEFTVSMTNSCGTTQASNTVPVVFKPREPVRQQIAADGALEFCTPGKVTLRVPAETGVTYTWRLNNVVTGTNAPVLDAMETGTYSLTIANDCRSVQALNTVSVIVRDRPRAQNISSNINPVICRGQTVQLSVPVEQLVTYAWSRNGVPIDGNESRLNVQNPGVYTATMTNGCGNRTSENVIEVSVIEPLADVTINTNKGTTFCVGESIQLSVPAQPAASYTWKRNGDVLTQGSIPVLTTTDAGVFTAEIYNACFSKVTSVELKHYPVPPPTIVQASLIDECDKERYLLRAEGDFQRYQWFLGTSLIAGANEKEYAPLLSAAYAVKAFDRNGCSSVSEPYPVVISPKRSPSIGAQGVPDSLLTLSDAGLSYQWYVDNKFIVGASQRVFRVLYNGAYKASIVYDDGCTTFTPTYIVQDPRYISYGRVATFIGESVVLPESYSLNVFPNPVSSELTVQYPGTINDHVVLRILSQYGQEVMRLNVVRMLDENGEVTLDVGNLASGMYILEIDNRFQRMRTKLVKE